MATQGKTSNTVLIGFGVLVFLMMVMSAASILSARNAEKAAKQADLIVQCTTPGTRCAELQADNQLRETAKLLCPILIELPRSVEREERRDEILASYSTCVQEVYDRLKMNPLPGVVTTPPTTVQEKEE